MAITRNKKRPPVEAAVATSPLFKLALEIRILIYELLLVQEYGILIPSDTFAPRRDYRRTDPTPWHCDICGFVSLSEYGCDRHGLKKHRPYLTRDGGFRRALRVSLPDISASLLQTCRIIRLEASPILYTKNIFQFPDPATARNFWRSSDTKQARAIHGIEIRFGSEECKRVTPWLKYFTRQKLSCSHNFPHLRHMTLNLDCWVGLESSSFFRSLSEGFRERSHELESVLILGLHDEAILDCFERLVDREDDSQDSKKLQRHVFPNSMGGRWKNALLWYGDATNQWFRRHGPVRDEVAATGNTGRADWLQRLRDYNS